MSLSTLDRRISAGDLMVRREPRGRQHRVFIVIEDTTYDTDSVINALADAGTGNTHLVVAQERIRGLEEQVKLLQEHLEWEHQRNAELFNALREEVLSQVSRQRKRGWWRFRGRR